MNSIRVRVLASFTSALFLGACGGGGGGSSAPPTFTIGGVASGVQGSGLVLQNNGGANLRVTADLTFTFASRVANGGAYDVTVLTQPRTPSQTCSVANGSGVVSGAHVTNVALTCTTNAFRVGGTVRGLAGAGLVLINNGGDHAAVGANGAFTFATSVASGATYDVRVLTQPVDPVQNCEIIYGSGTVGDEAAEVVVSCVTPQTRFAYSLDYNDQSVSIYVVDGATGQLRSRGSARVGVRPVDGVGSGGRNGSAGRYAYILNRGSATISAFAVDVSTGDFRKVTDNPYPTGAPADGAMRISIHPNQRFIYVTNGPTNNIAAFHVNQGTGELNQAADSPFAAGTHPNHLAIDARGVFAYAANRDSHDIYTYRIGATTAALIEVANSRVSTGANSSPMVLTLHATGRYAYVTNTGSNSVAAFSINASTGILTPIAGSPFAAGERPSDTAILHPSGRYLYVRNLGAPNSAGSVTAYAINASTGALSAIGASAAIGANSTFAAMHPTGRFLLVANGAIPANTYGPGSISVLSIDAATGALTSTQTPLSVAPYSVSVDPSGRFVYAASAVGNVHYSFSLDGTTGALTPLVNGAVTMSRDQPISLVAYSSADSPNPVTFNSRHAFVANTGDNTISGYVIDAASGALTAGPPSASAGVGPRTLVVHPRGQYVVSVNQTNQNDLASYAINASRGELAMARSTLATGGQAPVALAFHPDGRSVHLAHSVVTGPNSGMTSAFAFNPIEGTLSPVGGLNGIGTSTPLTSLAVAPNSRFMYFTTNDLTGWARIDDETGGYTSDNGLVAFGLAGKTALAVHPSGRFAYITIASDPGVVERYSISPHTGRFSVLGVHGDTVSGSTPRSITTDPTGRFAYVANTGASTVSMYRVNQATGALTSIGTDIAAGATPIAIAADYGGRYVYVLSQGTEQVLTYSIDQASGALILIAAAPAATGDMPGSLAVSSSVR